MTALGIYLACHPRLSPGALFPGSNQKLRFGKVLGNLLKQTGSESNYGTHSVRKGVATFACGGITGGPSIVSVCLRCGWSLGGVQDQYSRYEAAGDQFLGRVVSGLPVNDSKFALLPLHFRDSSNENIKSILQQMFPSLSGESNLSGILQSCLGSLAFHSENQREYLPANHPLLSILIFTNIIALSAVKQQLEHGESKWMQPTGIPPYNELYKRLVRQQESIDTLPDKLEERMEQVLEKKGVAAGNITRELLRSEIKALLVEVGLRANVSADDTAPMSNRVRNYHTWGGKFHVLPREFGFPSIDPLGAWMLWWFGNPMLSYPPFKSIPSDDLDTPQKKATLSEWSIMMRYIINKIEEKTSAPMPDLRDEAHAIELFNIRYDALVLKPSQHKCRTDQLKLTTVLRLVREVRRNGSSESRSTPVQRCKRLKRSELPVSGS